MIDEGTNSRYGRLLSMPSISVEVLVVEMRAAGWNGRAWVWDVRALDTDGCIWSGVWLEECSGEVALYALTVALLDTSASLGDVETGRGAGSGVRVMEGVEFVWWR